jgi:hypothetical protein
MGDQPRAGRVLKALAAAVIVLAAFLAGVLAERLRFDLQRSDMLRRYDRALREHQAEIMRSEKRATAPAPETSATR